MIYRFFSYKYFVIICLTLLHIPGFSQHKKPVFHGTFYHIADNREYFSQYAMAQTILGARVDLKAEFSTPDSVNKAFFGFNYLYEYGHTIDAHIPVLNLYYQYQKGVFDFYFGSFPRRDLLNYPLVLLTDSLDYYRPNIEGALAKISGKTGNITLWIDWTSRQTNTVRETFLAGFSTQLNLDMFYNENYMYMYHRAGSKNPPPDDHIRDNGGACSLLGLNLSDKLPFDKMKYDIGAAYSYDRFRSNPYDHNFGLISRIQWKHKMMGLDAVYYSGDKQALPYGDPFYSAGQYSRIDTYIIPFKSKHVSSKVAFSVHFAKDQTDYSQQIFVIYKFL